MKIVDLYFVSKTNNLGFDQYDRESAFSKKMSNIFALHERRYNRLSLKEASCEASLFRKDISFSVKVRFECDVILNYLFYRSIRKTQTRME